MAENLSKEKVNLINKTLKDLCGIPAPSGYEDERAEYVLNFVKQNGFDNAYIDDAKNVIWTIRGKKENAVLFTAHTDTVFPDREPMPFREDETRFYCPGVGDDTGSLVPMMIASCDILKNKITPENTLIFSANSCEEGLGNLKGIKELCKSFSGKIIKMYSFDGRINHVVNYAVGSVRFKVNVEGKGGHSFTAFGNKSAIDVLSQMINKIYSLTLPVKGNEKATFNVGVIEGGTSVNSICQKASMLCEYRATCKEFMDYMGKEFNKIFTEKYQDITIKVDVVGERPCANNVDEKTLRKMSDTAVRIQSKYSEKVSLEQGSTDCNIPLSLGIPAICMGAYEGEGEHTREEWITKDGLIKGYCICYDIITEELNGKV